MNGHHRRKRTSITAAALVASLACAALAASVTTAEAAGRSGGGRGDRFEFGAEAVGRLGTRLPRVEAAHGIKRGELRKMLLEDATLGVDQTDNLVYFDVLAPNEQAPLVPAQATSAAPPVTDPVFNLASLPGADKTIYLDFDGHVTEGTTWNAAYGLSSIVSPPYDIDGRPDAWSDAELAIIRGTWESVAEDFAPWNINVTTIDPGTEALRRSGGNDVQWGARVVITDDTFANCSCGGHAYIGSFDDSADEPTFVYNSDLVGVKEASSHEVGHMLNLAHDGTTTAAYYTGHGSGATSWAPIMGAAYYVAVSQWSQQEYRNANNTGSSANYNYGVDDLAIIASMTNGNGFGLRSDDHGDDAASASQLLAPSASVSGIIGTRDDLDVFSFSAGAGALSFIASPAASSPNLDIALTLRNSNGQVVATSNPVGALDASLSLSVAAGSYTLEIDGVGVGSPASRPPTGYSDYASIGQYSIVGTFAVPGPADTTPPAAPTGVQASASPDAKQVTLSWDANSESDLANYRVLRATGAGNLATISTVTAPTTSFSDVSVQPETTYTYVVEAIDTSANTSSPSAPVAVTTPSAPAPTNVVVNGGFEDGLSGWANSGVRSAVSTQRHSGSFSALLGSTTPKKVESKLTQTFTAPAGSSRLSFWYNMTCNDVVKNDFAKATLKDLVTRKTVTLMKVCSKGAGWVERTATVVPGRRYTLTLSNKDNGGSTTASFTYFDDVVVS